jgi:predicted amidohydrolase YtcJ
MKGLLIEDAQIGGTLTSLRVRDGRIHALGRDLVPEPGEARLAANGGALLPGLNDHHIHLFALAAAQNSLDCGPGACPDSAALGRALGGAAARAKNQDVGEGWVRGVGYHESVAGALDRDRLDAWAPRAPVRIQHRSGALWMLNSAALAALGIADSDALPAGAERDARGRPTGRLHRLDGWLRERLGPPRAPDLGPVGRALARLGVTGACDASPGNGPGELALFTRAARSGALPQALCLMGSPSLPEPDHPRIRRGAVKIMLDEDKLPSETELVARIRKAHAQGRGVAVHCVTRAELVMAAHGLEQAGPVALDRIEHASLAPPDAVDWLARLGVTVVSQPNFLHERGDSYRKDVEARDQPWLYRGRGFLDAGVPLGAGTDAPFGACDPWAAMRAAVHRRTASGEPMRAEEALAPERALALFTSSLEAPGRARGPLAPGQDADLVLLDRPWQAARERLDAADIRATLARGEFIWQREPEDS